MTQPTTYSERLGDIAILQINTQGFDALTYRQKQLAYHLAQAGLWGRAISMDQGSVHNLPLIAALMQLHGSANASLSLSRPRFLTRSSPTMACITACRATALTLR